MKRSNAFIYIMLLLIHFGCSEKKIDKTDVLLASIPEETVNQAVMNDAEKVPVQDYIKWVNNSDNGLKVEKTIEDFTYSLQYKPDEYVALMELKKDTVSATELKKKMSEYDGLQYFNFKIETDSRTELLKKNLTQTNEYYARIQYFSFDMQKDLKLIDGKDTLDCTLFHFERVFGLAPYATFVLGFPKGDGINNKTLYYNEKVFGSGKIYLTVQSENIKQIPSVIIY